MPGRVVVQYDKRDVETMKLIKLDLLGLRMLSSIDDALRDIHGRLRASCVDLDRLPEDIPEVFAMIQRRGHRGRLPDRVAGPDADAAQEPARQRSTTSSSRWPSSGPGPSRATRSIPTCAAARASSR